MFGQASSPTGVGQWFRYLTGVTMASAAPILIFVIGRLADSVSSGGVFVAPAFFWWNRRNPDA